MGLTLPCSLGTPFTRRLGATPAPLKGGLEESERPGDGDRELGDVELRSIWGPRAKSKAGSVSRVLPSGRDEEGPQPLSLGRLETAGEKPGGRSPRRGLGRCPWRWTLEQLEAEAIQPVPGGVRQPGCGFKVRTSSLSRSLSSPSPKLHYVRQGAEAGSPTGLGSHLRRRLRVGLLKSVTEAGEEQYIRLHGRGELGRRWREAGGRREASACGG